MFPNISLSSRGPRGASPKSYQLRENLRSLLDTRAAHRALAQSSYPKLLFVGDPGALVSPVFAESFAKRLRNLTVIRVGYGVHYLQEDHPQAIGLALRNWLGDLESSKPTEVAAD
jgi:haloalkane dehalogenase